MSETFSPPNMSSLVQGEAAKAYKERVGYFRIFDTLITLERMIPESRTTAARDALLSAQKKLLELSQTEEFVILPASKWNARKLKDMIDQAWYKIKLDKDFNLKSDAPQDPTDPSMDPSAQEQTSDRTQPPVDKEIPRKASASAIQIEDDLGDKRQYKALTLDEFKKMLSKLSFGYSVADVTPLKGTDTSFVLNFRSGEKKDHYDIYYKVDERGKPTISTKAGMTYDQAFNLIELSAATMGSSLRMTNPKMTTEDKDKLHVAAMTHGSRELMMGIVRQMHEIEAGKRDKPIMVTGELDRFVAGEITPEGILLQDCIVSEKQHDAYVPSKDMTAEIKAEHDRVRNEIFKLVSQYPQYFTAEEKAQPESHAKTTEEPVLASVKEDASAAKEAPQQASSRAPLANPPAVWTDLSPVVVPPRHSILKVEVARTTQPDMKAIAAAVDRAKQEPEALPVGPSLPFGSIALAGTPALPLGSIPMPAAQEAAEPPVVAKAEGDGLTGYTPEEKKRLGALRSLRKRSKARFGRSTPGKS